MPNTRNCTQRQKVDPSAVVVVQAKTVMIIQQRVKRVMSVTVFWQIPAFYSAIHAESFAVDLALIRLQLIGNNDNNKTSIYRHGSVNRAETWNMRNGRIVSRVCFKSLPAKGIILWRIPAVILWRGAYGIHVGSSVSLCEGLLTRHQHFNDTKEWITVLVVLTFRRDGLMHTMFLY